MKIVALKREPNGAILGVVGIDQRHIDVVFSVVGKDELAVVDAVPYVFGPGYAVTADEVHGICAAVKAFDRASR